MRSTALLFALILAVPITAASKTITEIIDSTGDGGGNPLN